MKVKSESEVAQSCPTLRDPMDCSPPGSNVHGIFQARVLEWGATAFSAWASRGNHSLFFVSGNLFPSRRVSMVAKESSCNAGALGLRL